MLFLPNYSKDVIIQAQQIKELGLETVILGCDGWSPKKISGQEAFNGAYFNHHWHVDAAADNPAAADFLQRYREVYHSDPVNMAALTADALGMLLNAAQRTQQPTPAALREQLAGLTNYPGITGSISFEGSGDPQKGTVILKVSEGSVGVYKHQKPGCPVDINL